MGDELSITIRVRTEKETLVSVGRHKRPLIKVLGLSMILGVYEFRISTKTGRTSTGTYRCPKRRTLMTSKSDTNQRLPSDSYTF